MQRHGVACAVDEGEHIAAVLAEPSHIILLPIADDHGVATPPNLNFGGVRLEDDILVTTDGHRVIGNPIPKTVDEVEKMCGRK